MPPKPLPFPIGIGVDLCEIARIQRSIVRHGNATSTSRAAWGRKIFSRLEWPLFESKLREYDCEKSSNTALRLSTWLAGRWAAKEAAIKAHRHRRLHLRDTSILLNPTKRAEDMPRKALALIDPPPRLVLMQKSVAIQRGLMGFSKLTDGRVSLLRASMQPPPEGHPGRDDPSLHGLYVRKLLVKEDDRRLADISISHDGKYAVAVCMALDEQDNGLDPVVDDGSGEPIHEPEWGDKGWPGVE